MNIAPLPSLPGSVAAQASADQQRQVTSERKAEAAGGVGTTDTDGQQTNDRDADGRLAWERPAREQNSEPCERDARSPDPSGQSGGGLDITA